MTTYERTRKDAKRFARDVRIGRTYYTIATAHQPWGDEPMYTEWTFTRRHPILGDPMCGHLTARGVLAAYGPVYDSRPEGIKGVADKPGHLYDPLAGAGDEAAADKLLDEVLRRPAVAGRR